MFTCWIEHPVVGQRPAVAQSHVEVGRFIQRAVRPRLHVLAELGVRDRHLGVVDTRRRERVHALGARRACRHVSTVGGAAGGLPVGDLAMELVAAHAGAQLEGVRKSPFAVQATTLLPDFTLHRLYAQRIPGPEIDVVQVAAGRDVDDTITPGVEIHGDSAVQHRVEQIGIGRTEPVAVVVVERRVELELLADLPRHAAIQVHELGVFDVRPVLVEPLRIGQRGAGHDIVFVDFNVQRNVVVDIADREVQVVPLVRMVGLRIEAVEEELQVVAGRPLHGQDARPGFALTDEHVRARQARPDGIAQLVA